MNEKLKDVQLVDVLPANLREDIDMRAMAHAIQPLLTKTLNNAEIADTWGRVQELTSAQLDHIAEGYDSYVWRDSWPLSVKRRVIMNVLLEKRKSGTIWAVKNAVSALGSAVQVTPWYDQSPMGAPYTFDVVISVGQIPNQSDADSQRDLMRAIDEAKAFRSHYTMTLAEEFEALGGYYGVGRPAVLTKLHMEGVEFPPSSVGMLFRSNAGTVTLDVTGASAGEVDWGDGVVDAIPAGASTLSHTYTGTATGELRVPSAVSVVVGGSVDAVLRWGDYVAHYSFEGSTLVSVPSVEPPHATSYEAMFKDCVLFDGPLEDWKTGDVANMDNMFEGAVLFNRDLSKWCVSLIPSNPVDFDTGASAWTEPRPDWGTCPLPAAFVFEVGSSGGLVQLALSNASSGTIDWGNGSTESFAAGSAVFSRTFLTSSTVRVELDHAGKVALTGDGPVEVVEWKNGVDWYTLEGCSSLVDVPTSAPDAKNFTALFAGCTSLVDGLDAWDVSHVETMKRMFDGATSFDGSLKDWDVSAVEDMSAMFRNASTFNGDVRTWRTPLVADMEDMFNGASTFDRDLARWCVSLIPALPSGFDTGASSWSADRPVWGTCPPPFHPMELDPMVGVTYDFGSMYSDLEKTTQVTSDGDPIANWENKGWLRSMGDMTQAVSANRPIVSGGRILFPAFGVLLESSYTLKAPFTIAGIFGREGITSPSGVWGTDHRDYRPNVFIRMADAGRPQIRVNDPDTIANLNPDPTGTYVLTIGKTEQRVLDGAGVDSLNQNFTEYEKTGTYRLGQVEVVGGGQVWAKCFFIWDRELTATEQADLLEWLKEHA